MQLLSTHSHIFSKFWKVRRELQLACHTNILNFGGTFNFRNSFHSCCKVEPVDHSPWFSLLLFCMKLYAIYTEHDMLIFSHIHLSGRGIKLRFNFKISATTRGLKVLLTKWTSQHFKLGIGKELTVAVSWSPIGNPFRQVRVVWPSIHGSVQILAVISSSIRHLFPP